MKVAALVLGLVALALAIGLVLLIVDLKRISDDLDFINHADTNALVTTGSNIGLIRTLAARINAVLNKTRRLQITQAEQNKQVRQMLTNLTHDIKTPLTVARGYAQLLKEGSADQEQLSKILNNLQSVDRYLHYLMDFNLIQEKSVNLDLGKVNLSALVQQELFNAFDSLTARSVTVEPRIQAGVEITTDQTMVSRVIQNLIGNWLKYAQDSAWVDLHQDEDGRIHLDFGNETKGGAVDVDRLMERFQTDDQSRTKIRSTGLGLSIVDSLVDSLGGSMRLESTNGIFLVHLLLSDATQTSEL
ncbi:HAMP domain-containing sensor histidine kinase [Bifidobacterium sp. H1HS16N]|uniref:Sensor-like histidine kinase SenX3 n=1 Tax=Bifidobacterium kimbladii TaxID=1293826 RepID=A0ABU3KDY1_9BIFI|nr:HAMP domain-containing sensor histidine kinase [Bifidobacterium sp. H1HS16N]MDT7508664.1 HAMP domain-containing sensor histidine kinase [Bifidobacterium sp. H1HS16N]